MTINTTHRPAGGQDECRIRIAAAGDVHFGRDSDRERAREAFAALEGRVDLILLAGDLTTHGEPEQAAILADAVRDLGIPVITVLGNHDHHSAARDEVTAVLEEAGIVVLDRSHHILEVCDTEVGIVGTKGFVGGFTGSHIPDFGEPLLRTVYAEAGAEVEALDEGLRAVALCPFRIVLLHYSPSARRSRASGATSGPSSAPIGSRRRSSSTRPDLVLHGHAHAGTFEGRVGEVPVYNVSVPVMGEDFWVFEMTGSRRAPSEVH